MSVPIGVVDVDLLVIRGDGEATIVENLKGGDARGDGRAAHSRRAVVVVLVGTSLSCEVNQPKVALKVQNSIVYGVESGDVSVDGLGAHLNDISSGFMGNRDQLLSVVQSCIVDINLEEHGPFRAEARRW